MVGKWLGGNSELRTGHGGKRGGGVKRGGGGFRGFWDSGWDFGIPGGILGFRVGSWEEGSGRVVGSWEGGPLHEGPRASVLIFFLERDLREGKGGVGGLVGGWVRGSRGLISRVLLRNSSEEAKLVQTSCLTSFLEVAVKGKLPMGFLCVYMYQAESHSSGTGNRKISGCALKLVRKKKTMQKKWLLPMRNVSLGPPSWGWNRVPVSVLDNTVKNRQGRS